MSTRATYQFIAPDRAPVTCYIHHDGYPEGGAEYFRNAVNRDRGGLCENFIRANENAELTGGHDAHGDTDYRYTVEESRHDAPFITVRGRVFATHSDVFGHWRVIVADPLAEFLNSYTEGRPYVTHAQEVRHLDRIAADVNASVAEAVRQFAKGWTGNATGCVGDVLRLLALDSRLTPADRHAWHAVLKAAAEAVPHMYVSVATAHGVTL